MEEVWESTDFTKKLKYLCSHFLSACDGIRLLLTESADSEVQDDSIEERRGKHSSRYMDESECHSSYILEDLGVGWIGQHKKKSKNNTWITGQRDNNFIFDWECDSPDPRDRSHMTSFCASCFLVSALKAEYPAWMHHGSSVAFHMTFKTFWSFLSTLFPIPSEVVSFVLSFSFFFLLLIFFILHRFSWMVPIYQIVQILWQNYI